MPVFPSTEWMQAYAQAVLAHERADELVSGLEGRYRFVVQADDRLARGAVHDLVVGDGTITVEEVGADPPRAALVITAGYDRWARLLTGRADPLMSLLMRRVRVEGDIGRLRTQGGAAGPLLDCLNRVPTTFAV